MASLSDAQSAVVRGRYGEALAILWEALATAQDRDDLATLSTIREQAHLVAVRASPAHAQDAQRIIAAIQAVHPQVAKSGARPEAGSTRVFLPMTTGNELPGMRVTAIIGPVFGLTVRSRDMFTQLGARIKGSTVGGELQGMTAALEQSRSQVLLRLEERARMVGASGVIALRFDTGEMQGVWTEVCAYGTAVKAEPE